MFGRPTTEQVLQAIAEQLRDTVQPDVQSETVRVLVAQMDQLLRGCAQRAAHEIAWAHEEAAAIAVATGSPVGSPAGLHLDDVVAWYDSVSRVLSKTIDDAFAAGDTARVVELKVLLDARSANEMRIVGALDLVGRG